MEGPSTLDLLLGGVGAILIYRIAVITYRLFFHPLRNFPGPWYYAASDLSILYNRNIRGRGHLVTQDLHKRYGNTVRISPNMVSCIGSDAWPQIYGPRKGEFRENAKDPMQYGSMNPDMWDHHILTSDITTHARLRRMLSHAFSDKAMQAQESLIQHYVDLLVKRMQERSGQVVDMVKWYNYTTFDVIGDLSFAESFGCLENSTYHHWVEIVFKGFKAGVFIAAARKYPIGKALLRLLVPQSLKQTRIDHRQYAMGKISQRLDAGSANRADFIDYMLKETDGKSSMSRMEILENANILLIAGTETTATALSGLTYLLCQNKAAYDRVKAEIRSTYNSEDEIRLVSTKETPFAQACIEEALRMYPPLGVMPYRVIRPGGEMVSGYYLPAGTHATVTSFAQQRSEENFAFADSFMPERWLADRDPMFANDKRHCSQPFSFGSRNCIGKNLAYSEMKLIFAKMLYNFDFELQPECENFIENQKLFGLWEKGPLPVKIIPVQR